MYHNFDFRDVLASSAKAAWQVEDVLPEDARFDFRRRFLPEALARTDAIAFLSDSERRTLNQIRGHEYLSLFGLVEEFILPFVLDHARPHLNGDDHRVRALLGFAGEEAKHIHLFRLFHRRFTEGFGTRCESIGPAEAIASEVLRHDPLSVALAILQIEWMTQSHYLDSVRGDGDIDPLFSSLLKHHWMEEAQHAKLDTLMVAALAEGRDEAGIQTAIDGYLEIGAFLDEGLATQASLNLDSFERRVGRALRAEQRRELQAQQHQALRWTYLGSGMTHPNFTASLEAMSLSARDRIAEVAPVFS
ncbi:MAG TPA: diiron oxygenase [Allosphingosinicella sp.]|nr:diiron oxygenase [Allosphingosinicella sp.]